MCMCMCRVHVHVLRATHTPLLLPPAESVDFGERRPHTASLAASQLGPEVCNTRTAETMTA